MTVAGIDFSTKAIDIVLLDDDTDAAEWVRIPLRGRNGRLELARSVRDLPSLSWWEEKGVWLLGIEDPVGRHAHTQKVLGMVFGATLALLPLQLAVIPTEPSEWMRLFLGRPAPRKSADRKALIGETARDLMPDERWLSWAPDAYDAYDAYGIAWAVRKLNANAIARSRA